MEPIEENSVAVPVVVPPAMLDQQETHRFARYIKEYCTAAQKNGSLQLVEYFGNTALIPREIRQLATQVLESDRQGEFGPAICDGCNWPYYWTKNGAALIADMQSFKMAADALLTSGPPAGPVDPSLLTQPASDL